MRRKINQLVGFNAVLAEFDAGMFISDRRDFLCHSVIFCVPKRNVSGLVPRLLSCDPRMELAGVVRDGCWQFAGQNVRGYVQSAGLLRKMYNRFGRRSDPACWFRLTAEMNFFRLDQRLCLLRRRKPVTWITKVSEVRMVSCCTSTAASPFSGTQGGRLGKN